MVISPRMPSKQTAASRLLRKLAVYLTYSSGIPFLRSSDSSLLWLTKSKYPLMSKVKADVTLPWFQAQCTSFVKVRIASAVELFDLPPN